MGRKANTALSKYLGIARTDDASELACGTRWCPTSGFCQVQSPAVAGGWDGVVAFAPAASRIFLDITFIITWSYQGWWLGIQVVIYLFVFLIRKYNSIKGIKLFALVWSAEVIVTCPSECHCPRRRQQRRRGGLPPCKEPSRRVPALPRARPRCRTCSGTHRPSQQCLL